jgi:hypothetical protein
MPNGNDKEPRRGMTPVPDPTILTTQQLLREILATRELLEAKIAGNHDMIDMRLHGIDVGIGQLWTVNDTTPRQVDVKIDMLRHLHDEKFRSIEIQFRERDARFEQSNRDGKTAIDAALQAAKEAVGEQNKSAALAIAKSETATIKQIDAQAALIQTASRATDGKIEDIKERLSRIEQSVEKGIGRSQGAGLVAGGMGQVIAAIAAIAAIAVAVVVLSKPTAPTVVHGPWISRYHAVYDPSVTAILRRE